MDAILKIFQNSVVKLNLIIKLYYVYDKKLQGYSFEGSGFPYNNNPINVYPYNVCAAVPELINGQFTATQIQQYALQNYVSAHRLQVTVHDEKLYRELLNLYPQIPDITCCHEMTNKSVLKPEFSEEATKRRDLRLAHMEKIEEHMKALKELGVEIEEMTELWRHWKYMNDDQSWYQEVFDYGTIYINHHEGTEFWNKMKELGYE